MTQTKLGTGNAYATITGFTFPAGLNPDTMPIPGRKRNIVTDVLYNEINIVQSAGDQNTRIGARGELFTEANLNLLRAQVKKTVYDSDGEIKDYFQKFYPNRSDKFYWVSGEDWSYLPSNTRQNSFPYSFTLLMVHPFLYHDAIATANNTTTNTTCTVSGGTLDNDGTAEVFPYFEVKNNTGNNITKVEITNGTNTLTWEGTIASGSSLRIVQEGNADLELSQYTAYLYATLDLSDTPKSSGMKGNRILLDIASDTNSIDFTLTGNNNTATCLVNFRERDR